MSETNGGEGELGIISVRVDFFLPKLAFLQEKLVPGNYKIFLLGRLSRR